MKWIISRYNHRIAYLKDYTDDYMLYDRSDMDRRVYDLPLKADVRFVENIGSDLYDKFTYIIDNYDDLPEVAVYTKANIFDFIKPREYEKIKDNKTFTPILTQDHHTYRDERGEVCFYRDGIYYERNDYWFLGSHPARYDSEIRRYFKMDEREYNAFAPGSNYILPKENILQHSKETYQTLRSYLEWAVYPGDAQLLERNLWYLWK